MVTDEPDNLRSAMEYVERRKGRPREALKSELDGTSGEEQLGALLEEYNEIFGLGKVN